MSSLQQKSTYFKRVVLILVLFSLAICIPYAVTVYNTAKEKVLTTIQSANDQSLQQIKYNYTMYDDTMSNLCMSIYLNNDNQGLLYNSNISHAESMKLVRDIKDTVLSIYPAVYAVSIYNASRDELYSTLENQIGYFNNTVDFIENVQDIPKLQPILRRIPYAGTGNMIYVFSYYIYDYTDSDNKPTSYVLLEENANWLINNFTRVSYLDGELINRIYLVDKDNNICSDEEVPKEDLQLLQKGLPAHVQTGNDRDSVSYEDSVAGKEYLITRLALNQWGDSLIMIQDHDRIFAELISLQRNFRIVIGIWALLYILAIFLMTQSLYRPIDKLVKFVNSMGEHNKIQSHVNEFSQLMKLYKETHDQLADKDTAKQYFIRRYQFEKLLTDETDSVWKGISAYFPEHWLVTSQSTSLRVLKLTLQMDIEQTTEEDVSLFLFIIQNILSELLEQEKYQAEIFRFGDQSVCGILQASEGDRDAALEKILRETQQCLEERAGLTFSAAYSDTADHPLKLSALYRQAEDILRYSFVYGRGSILNSGFCPKEESGGSALYPEGLEKKLIEEIRCGNSGGADELLDTMFDEIRGMQYDNIHTCITTLANHLYVELKELFRVRGVLARFQLDQIYHFIVIAESLEEVKACFKKYVRSALEISARKSEPDKGQTFVMNIQAYVEEHYQDPNLSSQSVGDHLGLTGKYVMKKFQDCTGNTLNDYICRVRMGKAAQLLVDSDISIGKVAEQVGILNENYFYRLFKKTYGCTPREFSNQKGVRDNRSDDKIENNLS